MQVRQVLIASRSNRMWVPRQSCFCLHPVFGVMSNILKIMDIIDLRTAKWGENGVFIIMFSSVVTALFSTPASPITTKLLLATGEPFTLSADSSQEVILHVSLLQQLWKCSLAAFLFPWMTAWQLLPESELDDLPLYARMGENYSDSSKCSNASGFPVAKLPPSEMFVSRWVTTVWIMPLC